MIPEDVQPVITWPGTCPALLCSVSMNYPRSESDGEGSLYLARHNLTAFHREEQNLSLFGIWNEIYRIY